MEFGSRRAYKFHMNTTTTVFYDGLCPLCSREIDHYRRHVTGQEVRFLDINSPGFDAASHGLDSARIHQVMHVKVGDEIRTGVDAFVALWTALPAFRWLARLARVPGVHFMMTMGYHVFARLRPWLPRRRRADCVTGVCER